MDLYTKVVAKALFPLHEALKGHDTVRVRRSLERTQWLAGGALRDLQMRTLRAFLEEIGRSVPYYRSLFSSHDFNPAEIHDPSCLAGLPFLDKQLIRDNFESLKSQRGGSLREFSTGGSTGEPLRFCLDSARVSHDVAAQWRATRWWQVDIGDPEIVFWGSPIELDTQDRIRIWRDRLLRSTLLSAFDLSEGRLDEYLAIIRRRRPRMLFGYPSVIARLAAHARDQGVDMHGAGVKVAFVTAEKLYDWQRDVISEVFTCAVANGYGGRDAGFLAHECPQGGMHVTAEDVIIEIIDSNGQTLPPGTLGEVVVTHMRTRAFPFLRYRTGDMAVMSTVPCPCGRGLPLLQDVAGRSTDFIVTRSGKVLHGLALIYVLREIPEIDAFKIIQVTHDRIRILVVPGTGYCTETEARIKTGILSRLDSGMEIAVEKVDHILPEKSGKYRYVVSLLADGSQGEAR